MPDLDFKLRPDTPFEDPSSNRCRVRSRVLSGAEVTMRTDLRVVGWGARRCDGYPLHTEGMCDFIIYNVSRI